MNYLILFLLLSFGYYLVNLKNKSILFLVVLFLIYIYNEKLLPDTYWNLPSKKNIDTFEFGKLSKLYNKFIGSVSIEESKLLKHKIQNEINTIYFSFPNHLHNELDKFLYHKYGFVKKLTS